MSSALSSAETVVQTDTATPDPGFKRVRSQTLELTREKAVEMANEHLALPHSPTEREFDKKRLGELIERIQRGWVVPFSWATADFQGTKYRMNGQHSSRAITESANHLPETVVIHLDHFSTQNADGMGRLFRQFDARFSQRSKQDISGAYQGLVRELADIPRKKAKLGLDGIAWFERAVEKVPVPSGDELYTLYFRAQFHPFLRWLDSILSVKTPELNYASIVGAMYATFLKSESGSQEFWSRVARPQELSDDSDARSVLSQELVKIREDRGKVEKTPPGELYAKCIKAWAAFRAGEQIRSLNVNVKKGFPPIAA